LELDIVFSFEWSLPDEGRETKNALPENGRA